MRKSFFFALFVATVLLSGAFTVPQSFALTYNPSQQLTASDGSALDFFGRSVSYSGETVVVGSPGEKAIYVFDRNVLTNTWTETQKLSFSDPFGNDVSVSGDTLVSASSDRLYVNERNLSPPWKFAQIIDLVGVSSVAIDGDTIAATITHPVTGGVLQIYDRDPTNTNNWILTKSQTISGFRDAVAPEIPEKLIHSFSCKGFSR